MDTRPAIVARASSGIGYELAAARVSERFDLLMAADRSEIAGVVAERHRRPAEPGRGPGAGANAGRG